MRDRSTTYERGSQTRKNRKIYFTHLFPVPPTSPSASLTSTTGDAKELEKVAREIYRSYERTGRGVGKGRDAVWCLLGVREALELRSEGRFEAALEVCLSLAILSPLY